MDCTWIESEILAAGSMPVTEKDIQSLSNDGVRAIISLTEYPLTTLHEITPNLLEKLDIRYFHIPIPDQHPPTTEQAEEIVNIIGAMKNESRSVFVHCHAGVGRTGTVLHIYYISQGLSFEKARENVRAKRIQCVLLSNEQDDFLKKLVIRK
jgi:atypical dual specificity phosphatase